MKTKAINTLTEQCPATKTLTMQLKPVGYTKNIMDHIFSNIDNSIVSMDKIRNERYPEVKLLLDAYYRFAVQDILESYRFDDEEVKKLYSAYEAFATCDLADKKKCREDLATLQNKFCKNMSEYSKKTLVKFGLDKYSELFKPGSTFMKWVDTQENAKDVRGVLSLYESNISYFTKYKLNRELLFADKMVQGSICTRAMENMEIMFENMRSQIKMAAAYPELAKETGVTESIMKNEIGTAWINTMFEFFSPHGIFMYNQKIADYNMAVNEYVLKEKIARNKPQYLRKMYKQILFESEKAFAVYSIKDTEELKMFLDEAFNKYNEASSSLKEMLDELMATPGEVFIKTSRLTGLCKDAYKIPEAFNVFNTCFSLYLETLKTKKEKAEAEKKYKKSISFEDAIYLIDTYGAGVEAYNGIEGSKILKDFVEYGNDLRKLENTIKITGSRVPDETIMELQDMLTAMNDALAKYRHFTEPADEMQEKNIAFYNSFLMYMEAVNAFNGAYNLIRNFLTRKNEVEAKKIPVSFNINGLMSGMSISKEMTHHTIMLKKDGLYYLCIIPKGMTPKKLGIGTGTDKKGESYKKLMYQIAKDAYMALPQKYFGKKCVVSEELQYIKNNKLYVKDANDKDSMRKMIEYYLQMLHNDAEWNAYYDFSSLKTAEEYDNIVDFFADVDRCTTLMAWVDVPAEEIDKHVASGNLYMFQLYRKDFGEFSKGKKDMFTMYLEAAFSDENVKDSSQPHITINGGGTIFYQPKKQEVKVVHPAGVPIENRKGTDKKHSVFSYDIIKDKRHTQDKLILNLPMTFNAHVEKPMFKELNEKVNTMVANHEFDHIISVTRSFRNLLYYRVTDFDGVLVEQGSLNVIDGTDYYEKINSIANERLKQQKNWTNKEPIKNVKDGYVSLVVHKLAMMALKYNAIIIVDRYSSMEKNRSFALEKTLFKSFEEKLISKLSYLVLKDAALDEAGSALHPYQLAQPVDFLERTLQSGIIYFVNAGGTGNTDPETGYVSRLYFKYKNKEAAAAEVNKFNFIMYNEKLDAFQFNCNYSKFGIETEDDEAWALYIHGKRHWLNNTATTSKERHKKIDIRLRLENLFAKYGIELEPGKEYPMTVITDNENVDAGFYKDLFFILNLGFKFRFVDYLGEQDYAVSPVEKNGAFFHTEKGTEFPSHDAVKAEMLRRKFTI